jgi:Papain family cysteine protease
MKKNSLLAFILLIFSGLMAACGGSGQSTGQAGEQADQTLSQSLPDSIKALAQGCDLNKTDFDKAEVFEPLAMTLPENNVPGRFTLEKYAPRRLSQGSQGSCTAWAAAYSAATISRAVATGEEPNAVAYSPSFVYNQITRGNCTGTHIGKTLEKIVSEGLVGLGEFPYSDDECNRQPDANKRQKAAMNRIQGFNRLTMKDDDYKIDLSAIKQNISQGAPVVIGMAVGGSFYDMVGKKFWRPTRSDYAALEKGLGGHIVDNGGASSFGGHAMTVIGYDDNLEGGAFQIMNSWGEDWGDRGLFWMKYEDFKYFTNQFYGEAYGLYPVANKTQVNDFEAAIGLFLNQEKTYIPFKGKAGNVFTTSQSLRPGTKFKIAVKNTVPCHTYVIGQETDGTSYVLFPYTEKHSPYCGITGARLFPKDFSLQLDDKGKVDVMAVVFTKEKLDYQAFNQKISASKKATYSEKIAEALGNTLVGKPVFNIDNGKISFRANSQGKNAVAVVFEINKG